MSTLNKLVTKTRNIGVAAVAASQFLGVLNKDEADAKVETSGCGNDNISQQNSLLSRLQLPARLNYVSDLRSTNLASSFADINTCQCEESSSSNNEDHQHRRLLNIQRSRTIRIMSSKAIQNRSLSSLYDVDWKQQPIGEGAFGHVLLATHKSSGERVALKRIPKKLASREDFQREMEALLRIQKWGGHPHICALREHFDEGGYYYLILDLVEGGEMFDHLVNHGAYSEADAARLVSLF